MSVDTVETVRPFRERHAVGSPLNLIAMKWQCRGGNSGWKEGRR